MYYYRVKIAYKGTQYFGWQAQSNDTLYEAKPTVEGRILNCLKKMTRNGLCTLSAASRTDGGVHAQGQRAKITLAHHISSEHLLLGLNSLLPADIRIRECEPSTKEYQPNRSSISKEYHYYFCTDLINNVATSDVALHLPIEGDASAVIEQLQRACQLFVGQYDFRNFCSQNKEDVTTIREVFCCEIQPLDISPLGGRLYYLKIVGDGFLKYMIRYVMGALIELAQGNITIEDIRLHLEEDRPDKLSPKAKAKGLHLINIEEA